MADPSEASVSRSQLKAQLQQMDDEDFEHFVADLWRRHGWEAAVSQQSRDKSLDVLVEKEEPYHQRHAIQAKRYQAGNRVSGPKISEYASLREQFDADTAVVVTTSGFTEDAQERAETLNVKLVNGDDLVDMVIASDSYDLVDYYIELPGGQNLSPETTVEMDPHPNADAQQTDWTAWILYPGIFYTGFWLLLPTFSSVPASSPVVKGFVSLILLASLAALMIGLYEDVDGFRDRDVEWSPSYLWIFGATLLPVLVLPAYGYTRRQYVEQ
jgi:cytochrome b involved in lipid metabolism